MLRSKIQNAYRKLKCSSLEAPHREESNGGIANVVGPKLRLPEAKRFDLTLLRMRRTLSNIFCPFFASRRRNFGPSTFAIPPLDSSRWAASNELHNNYIWASWNFDLNMGVNGTQNPSALRGNWNFCKIFTLVYLFGSMRKIKSHFRLDLWGTMQSNVHVSDPRWPWKVFCDL